MNDTPPSSTRQLWGFVPTMGLFQALTFAYVSVVPGVFLKSIGASNAMVGMASLFYIPVALRFLTGMLIDRYSSKRVWALACQLVQILLSVLAGVSIFADCPLSWVLVCFGMAALSGALLDVAMDGLFLLATPTANKAFFGNLKVQAFRIGNAVAQGGYVIIAGFFAAKLGDQQTAWGAVFLIHAAILAVLALWNFRSFPRRADDVPDPRNRTTPTKWLAQIIAEFIRQPGMGWIFAYLAIYRVGEAMLNAMKVPFMIDPVEKGGLGLSLQQIGLMNGILVFLTLVVGGLLGGWAIQRWGLKRTLIPGILLTNLPTLLFIILVFVPASTHVQLFGIEVPVLIQSMLCLEALGYALGFAPFIYVQILVSNGPARATLFALVVGVTNLGWTIPGALSGYLQEYLGYTTFFIVITFLGMITLALAHKVPAQALETNNAENG